MNERYEQTSKWTSEWPSTHVLILGLSEPLCSNLELLVLTSLLKACFIGDHDFKGEKAAKSHSVETIVNDDVTNEPRLVKLKPNPGLLVELQRGTKYFHLIL